MFREKCVESSERQIQINFLYYLFQSYLMFLNSTKLLLYEES